MSTMKNKFHVFFFFFFFFFFLFVIIYKIYYNEILFEISNVKI